MSKLRRPTLMLAIAASLSLGLAACDRDASAPTTPAADAAATAPAAPKPQLGSFGFDAAGMDRNVAAGDDFFGFANGSWVKNTEIPADRSSFGSFNVISEKTLADTRAILEGAAADTKATGETKQIGDYYAAFMDEAGIESRGMGVVKPELDAIGGIADKSALATALGGTLRADVDLRHAWAKPRKKRWSGVKPSNVWPGLPCSDSW